MRKFNQKIRFELLMLAIIYRFLLRIIYVYSLYPTYKYVGFEYEANSILEIASFALFTIFTVLLHRSHKVRNEMSDYLIWSLYLISFIPFSVMCGCGAFDTKFVIANHVYWLLILIFNRLFSKIRIMKLPHLTADGIEISNKTIGLIGIVSILVNLFISYRYVGFRIVLDLFDVYSLRSEVSNAQIPTLLYYAFCWMRTIGVLLLAVSLLNQKRVLVIIYTINMLISFSVDGMKATLFSVMITFALYIIVCKWKPKRKIVLKTMYLSFIGISLLSFVEEFVIKSKTILAFIFFRVEFLVVQIGSWFFDFFIKNEPDYFRTSFLRHFGAVSPYKKYGINYLISGIYGGDYHSEANNGLISDAMTNFGIIGILIMPIVLMFVFRVFDYCSQGLDEYLVVVLGVYLSLPLTNGFLLTNLMTNGLLVLMFVLLFVRRNERTNTAFQMKKTISKSWINVKLLSGGFNDEVCTYWMWSYKSKSHRGSKK